MKKYKIIKTFPNQMNDYKVGDIITECGYKGLTNIAKDWPEYFEEVKEYPKIVAVKNKYTGNTIWFDGEKAIKREDNMGLASTSSLQTCLVHGAIIYQVAVSEDVVLTVGDKVKYTAGKCNYDSFVIDNFYYNSKESRILARSKCFGIVEDVTTISKVKNPIFTTEDGIDKYYKDNYYYIIVHDKGVLPNAWEVLDYIVDWENSKKVPLGKVQFHNLDKALIWIKQNKPKFSIKDVEDALECALECNWPSQMREKVKQKLGI